MLTSKEVDHMNSKAKFLVMTSLLAASLILTAAAQQKADTAVDPVCGMTVVKAGAKATYDYKGTAYYFCSTGCKDAFAKDPEKYLKKQAETKEAPGAPTPMMQHKMAQGMPMGQAGCPMMGGGMMMHRRMMMGGRMGMMGHGMMGRGMMMGGGMVPPTMREVVDIVVENTVDGATLKVTSKDPETVKLIQEHFARMKENRETMKKAAEDQAACCANCPMKKK
jgi:YHS domain-containing protein